MGNAATNTGILLSLLLQAQQAASTYQRILAKANAEGRDVSDEEVAEVTKAANAAIDNLEKTA